MNTALDLLKLAVKTSDPQTFNNHLQVCKECRLFQGDDCNAEEVAVFVNSLLNVSDECEKGWMVLGVFLPQTKSEIIARHIMHWLQQCLKGIQFQKQSLLYDLIGELIIYSKDYSDIKKQTSLTIIPKFLDHFFKKPLVIPDQNHSSFLNCLEKILIHYGKACGNWKAKIEHYILSQLGNSPNIIIHCARCFLKLTTAGCTISDVENYKLEWYNKQKFLISLLHINLDSTFSSITLIQGAYDQYIIEHSKKYLPEIVDTSPLIRIQKLSQQFISLSEFLCTFLVESFPVCKRVYPEAILSVICRGLAVNCRTLEVNLSNDSIILSTQIPSIHKACVNLLDSLIRCCRRSLYPQSEIINKLLLQILKWTEVKDYKYGQIKPYSSLRSCAYNCFSNWLTVSRACSGIEIHINDVMPSIMSDIHSEKPSITLCVKPMKRLKGKLGKKDRRKNAELSSLQDNKVPLVINPEANNEICEAALNFIPCLLEASSANIPPNIHKQLQERIVNELIMVQTAQRLSCELSIPYSNEKCRSALYKALLALCNNHHPEYSVPYNYALQIFTEGINDPNFLISRFCGQAVGNIEKMLLSFGTSFRAPLNLNNEMPSLTYVPVEHKILELVDTNEKITDRDETVSSDSIIIESITNLFEKNLKQSKENEEIQQECGRNISSIQYEKDSNNLKEIEQIENESLSFENKESESVIDSDNNITETDGDVETKKRPMEENSVIECNQEKKKRYNGHTQIGNIRELESEMLATFIDVL